MCQVNHTNIIFASKIKPYRKQDRMNWLSLYENFLGYVFAHENIKNKTNVVSLEELQLRIKPSESTNKTTRIIGLNSQTIFKQFAILLLKEYIHPERNEICKTKCNKGNQITISVNINIINSFKYNIKNPKHLYKYVKILCFISRDKSDELSN